MDKTPEGHEASPFGAKRLQLKIAARAIGAQRKAIWEATRQYVWWLLTVVIMLMYLGTSVSTSFFVRTVIILVGLLAAAIVALIGLAVVRRETEALGKRVGAYERLCKELELEDDVYADSGGGNKSLGSLIGGVLGSKKSKMEAWDWLQGSLVLAATLFFAGFVGVLVYAIVR